MSILIGTTIPPFKVEKGEDVHWLNGAEKMIEETLPNIEGDLYFFAALEVDARGMGVYESLLSRMKELEQDRVHIDYWTFSIDDNDTHINGANRLIRICTGRNLVEEYACRNTSISHILFLDSDLKVPSSSINKLLEMKHPVVGGDVPSYCLGGPWVEKYDFPVKEHWNTAGYLLVERQVFRKVKWRADLEAGASDDPCFAADCIAMGFGPTYVRKDLIGIHPPLAPLEARGHDLEIKR